MKKNLLGVFTLFILSLTSIYAQAPATWVVNPSAYNHSMTITAVLNMSSVESRDTQDVVAAFIGSDVRGVGSAITPIVSSNRYVAYFVIYSNDLNELVTFKLYNRVTNKVTNSVTLPVKFIADGNIGTFVNPLVIKDNNVPTDLTMSNLTIEENKPASSLVGTLNVVDEDLADTHVFTFLDGVGFEDNTAFEIFNGSIYAKSSLDFEAKSRYTIRIQAEDSKMGKIVKTFQITVIDDELPTVFTLSKNETIENLPVNSVIGDFNVTKENRNVFDLTLVSGIGGDDNASFEIVNNQLRNKAIFDFETKSIYKIRVQATNTQNDVLLQTFEITVKDDNLPTIFSLSKDNIDENLAVGTIIGDFFVVKENRNNFNLSLSDEVGGEDNASFELVGSALKSKLMYDFEDKKSFRLRIKAENTIGEVLYANFVIHINDVNDAPVLITSTNYSIKEDLEIGGLVGVLTTKDQDQDVAKYSFLNTGSDYKYFQISGNELLLKQRLDFETQESFQFDLVSNDGRGGEVTQTLLFTVVDVNENPVILNANANNLIAFSVSELDPKDTIVGKIEITDQDKADSHTYKIVSDEKLPFAIDANGVVTLVGAVDYEKKSNYSFQVVVTDNGTPQLNDAVNVEIEIEDEIEAKLAFNNFVSPNNDGKNDFLVIENIQLYKDYNLSIYNVRGQLVFSVVRYENNWSGEGLSQGEYYLYFSGKNSNSEEFIYKEVINLVVN
jgi:gliding motility-associated-like protein